MKDGARDRVEADCIIVSYNSLGVIDACLTSILDAGVEARRIHVVDNASSDGTVEHLTGEYPGLDVEQSRENLGFSRANNLGARRASSDVLVFVNPDTEFLPEALDALSKEVSNSRKVGVCGPLILDRNLRPKPESYLLPTNVLGTLLLQSYLWKPIYCLRKFLDPYRSPYKPRRRAALSGACLVIRRDVFFRVGGFNESLFMYAEDVELCARIAQAGLDIVQVPAARMIHLGGSTYTGSRATFFNSLKSLDLVFLQGSSLPTLVVKRFLVASGLSVRWLAFRLLTEMGSGRYDEAATSMLEGIKPFLSFKALRRKPLDFPNR